MTAFKPIKGALLILALVLLSAAIAGPFLSTTAESQPEVYHEVLIYLKEQADTTAAAASAKQVLPSALSGTRWGKNQVRAAVVEALEQTAEKTQASVLDFLAAEKEHGRVESYNSYFVVNIIYASLTEETLSELEEFPEVKEILPNETIELIEPGIPPQPDPPDLLSENKIEWNIERTGAPEVWEKYGFDGSGIIIGVIDSGVEWDHESLQNKWRGFDPLNPDEPDPEYNWYDYVEDEKLPYDAQGHGTHVTGIILGSGRDNNNYIGMAPGAQWIATRVFDSQGKTTINKIISAGEYMLAPQGKDGEPRPDKAPDIINNSWGGTTKKDDWYREMTKNWRAAGILPVFAAGNDGPDAESVQTPGSYPESLAVAATDQDNNLANFSSRGPGPYPDTLKPEISAPGVNVRSATPGNSYKKDSGTSMAAPHLTGAAALLLSSGHPLEPDALESYLKQTATSLTSEDYPESPNYGFGHGLVDVYRATTSLIWEQGGIPLRVAGNNRFETAVEISKLGWPEGADTVFLARGDDFPDSMAGAPLAYLLDAPILLTGPEKINEQTIAAIETLGAEKAFILGGTNAVSSTVQDELIKLYGKTDENLKIERIYGSNRYETAAEVARRLVEQKGSRPEKAFLVSGENYPDALSTAAYSASATAPVLLSKKNSIPEATKTALKELEVNTVVIVGGEGALSAKVKAALKELNEEMNEEMVVKRVAGEERYKTSLAMAEKYLPEETKQLFIATGDDFPDGLAGSVLSAKKESGILLVPGGEQELPGELESYIYEKGINNLVIYGGTSAVSEEIAAELEKLLMR